MPMTMPLSPASHLVATPCQLMVAPIRAALHAGQHNTLDVLVRIQAPDAPTDMPNIAPTEQASHAPARPPQAVALVIDRSGSMAGRPLAEARRCAEYVVSKLRPTDSVALVQFDNRVQRLWPAVPLGDGAPLRAAIAGIQHGGSTHLHGGWHEGADTLSDVSGHGLKRVILLSDGQANNGLTDTAAIAAQCAEWAARGITTSTYGLGDSFNEELMVAMARAGGGNHYYGDTADDLMDPFEQELALLGNLCLRDLQLLATAAPGVTVQMVNDLPALDGGWRLPDLAWGAEAWAMLRLQVPQGALPALGQLLGALEVRVQGKTLEGDPIVLAPALLTLPVVSASAWSQLVDDALVSRRLVELAAADALSRMRGAADHHDWHTVDRLLAEASQQFADSPWVAAVLAAMKDIADTRSRERMMKETLYSSSKLRSRLSTKDEAVSLYDKAAEGELPAYLRRKVAQGKAVGNVAS